MTKTYKITGMSCNHCVARVKNELQKLEAVVSADVSLPLNQATLELRELISVEQLQKALDNAGAYAIKELNGK